MNYHDGDHLIVMFNIQSDNAALNQHTDEHYHMEAYENTGVVIVKIRAETIFGARHALETLAQLIIYDNIRNELQVVSDFEIEDRPVFAHRGFLLDTSRNYFPVDSIKRTIGKSFDSIELTQTISFGCINLRTIIPFEQIRWRWWNWTYSIGI